MWRRCIILSSSKKPDSLLVFAVSLTKLHPGAGRSPGIVDLPVIRDPLGYPFIPGTMFKGSLKTNLIKKYSSEKEKIRCLLGPEPEEPEKYTGALTISDLYPLFLPAPSTYRGLVYVTSRVLLSRAYEIARTFGNHNALVQALGSLLDNSEENKIVIIGEEGQEKTRIGAYTMEADFKNLAGDNQDNPLKSMEDILDDLYVLYHRIPLSNRIVILPEEYAVPVIESVLIRISRVRLDRETKTVEQGGLWTEEYIPWGTIFMGAIIDNGFKHNNCKEKIGDDPTKTLLQLTSNIFTLAIGGKETVGGGITKILLLKGGSNEQTTGHG
ncbi:MAG: type III-B CRISPR module RAMP protein Cmr4 [Desulfurococcales archaeon]|nr:type III-B CRISPR module RAMP protein Cmr4 [Desulfurococcales archaeon]